MSVAQLKLFGGCDRENWEVGRSEHGKKKAPNSRNEPAGERARKLSRRSALAVLSLRRRRLFIIFARQEVGPECDFFILEVEHSLLVTRFQSLARLEKWDGGRNERGREEKRGEVRWG